MKSIAVLIRDNWLKNRMKANESATHTAFTVFPNGAFEEIPYNGTVLQVDDNQSQTFDSGGEDILSWDVLPPASKTVECVWSHHDSNSTNIMNDGPTFQCNDMLEIVSPNVTCCVTSISECFKSDELSTSEAFNGTSLNPGLELNRTRTCISCLRENSTSVWALRFTNSSENIFSSLLSYGSELLCSFGSCSSALCDTLTINPSPTSSSTQASSNTSLPILPVPSLSSPSTAPPSSLYIVQCRIPELMQVDDHLPFNVSQDDLFLNATAGSEDDYEYDFSFLFLAMFILAGGIGNILVCLAVSLSLFWSPLDCRVNVLGSSLYRT